MALTKVSRGLLSTGIVDNSNATAITIDGSENVLVNTANAGASGLSLSNGSNLSFAEGANSSIANLFRQTSSADSFLGSGYRFSATANKAESSYASSWARTAIGVGYGNIKFYADAAATVAVGTDITPTERMRIDSSGNLSLMTDGAAIKLFYTEARPFISNSGASVTIKQIDNSTTNAYIDFTSWTNTSLMRLTNSGNLLVGGTSLNAASSVGFTAAGQIRQVFASGVANDSLFGAISGVSNGFQITQDASNNQSYIFHNGGSPSLKIDSSGEVILNAGFQVGELRIHANQIASGYTTDGEDRDVWINYTGYNGGATRFRDFRVGNGKQVQIVFVDGSAGSVAITGSLSVSGSFSKGSGSFKIDHPLPAKTETHHLVHSFIEGPQADNIYRGKIDLVDGSATVNIDTATGMTEGTYVLLNTNTQCFTSNESGWTAVKGSVSGNTLTITAQESCTDTISWMVIGERQDQHMIETEWTDDNGKVIVEPLKELEERSTALENN
jgi:hypothetical protein